MVSKDDARLAGRRPTAFITLAALTVWLGAIHLNLLVLLLIAFNIPSIWAITLLVLWVGLAFLPIQEDSNLGRSVSKFICHHVLDYFPIDVVLEDSSALDPERPHVIGVEPHSVLPIGLIALTRAAGKLPLSKSAALATSAIFYVPVLRHIWSWLGLAPASRAYFVQALSQGRTIALVPGGVQECFFMRPGLEVVFLKKRFGFVRLAMQAGAPLVPTFIFGQTATYRWWMPTGQWYTQLSRAIGFAPLIFWGLWGTPLPYDSPMRAVVGRPIAVEKVDSPTMEQVTEVHAQFLKAMEELFDRHKAAAGYPDLQLRIV